MWSIRCHQPYEPYATAVTHRRDQTPTRTRDPGTRKQMYDDPRHTAIAARRRASARAAVIARAEARRAELFLMASGGVIVILLGLALSLRLIGP